MTALDKRPIHKKSLHELAVSELRELIIGGQLEPGARLVEAQLCEIFNISRTPLREAVKLLEVEGLVTLLPNSGAHVSVMTEGEIADLFEVVSDLERLAVELAVKRMSERDLRQLQRWHDKMLRLYRDRRRRECFQTDFDIHNFLVEKSGNKILATNHAQLMVRARRGRYLALFSQDRWDEAMTEHEQFMAEIVRRDKDAAGKLMHQHVTKTGTVLRQLVAEKNSSAPA